MKKFEMPETVQVSEVFEEAEGIKTLTLPVKMNAGPGQFCNDLASGSGR